MKEEFCYEDLPSANQRFTLGECLGEGVHAKVFKSKDSETGKDVAIKIQSFIDDNMKFIQEEYNILSNFSNHPNLVQFYGAYKNLGEMGDEVWFVMELCGGGTVMDLVRGVVSSNRRMAEEHISLILKEILKALTYLHENNIMHRDIKGSNVLLTTEGDIKLSDFGLSRVLKSEMERTNSCLGSPNWMAPEVISVANPEFNGYDSRADVWSVGILALELSNGKSPYHNMHPTRAIFQIARNPPPGLDLPGNWSDTFIDFIEECLVKNPEHRPFMVELLEHPFFELVPKKYYYLNQELLILNQAFGSIGRANRLPEMIINTNLYKKGYNEPMEQMLVEDLSALDEINEEIVLEELNKRMSIGQSSTFVGDVLLILNPNEQQDVYGEKQHSKYQFTSRSDCAPHIFTVADSVYQAALHQDKVQHIILTGESSSGKTTNFLHLIEHLLFLGRNKNINQGRIRNAIKLLQAFTHASTPSNDHSTRAVFHVEINYSGTGKNTGAHFEVYQIEKWRISSLDESQANFHILYYFYDGIQANGELNKYLLRDDRQCRYLRIPPEAKCSCKPRDDPKSNTKKFQKILEILREFLFGKEEIEAIFSALAAILVLGDIDFESNEIVNKDCASKVAQLLKIEEEGFISGLTSSHLRDVLANTLYSRVVQYIVSAINSKLCYGRAIFGDKYAIKVLDFYGFESFKSNSFSQFLINCTNEQIQYFYNQAVFSWEELESVEENIPYQSVLYYNNKKALDEMLGAFSVLALVEEATKENKGRAHIISGLINKNKTFVSRETDSEFCANHYAGSVVYDATKMAAFNRDVLPAETIKLLRSSNDAILKTLFMSKLNKMGNSCVKFDEDLKHRKELINNEQYLQKNAKQFSQTAKLYSAATTFKASSLELMKELSISARTGGAHFVRCLRSDFAGNPQSFHKELIKQQLRALAVVETATVRKRGFSLRIPFMEFLKRYKFLAFDFTEAVDITKENCRLLLIRLNMENWAIGKTKVFLKYYHEEYLSRLYEKQVKKIIKIQALIRSYLIKRKMAKKLTVDNKSKGEKERVDLIREEAAIVVQKAYRNYYGRKHHKGVPLDNDETKLASYFFNKWKRKSVYQILLQYRASQYQDLYNLSQQVHLYNQYIMNEVTMLEDVELSSVVSNADPEIFLGENKSSVLKLPFRLDNIPFYDTVHLCHLTTKDSEDEENWDSPFYLREISDISAIGYYKGVEAKLQLTKLPFKRQPSEFTPLSNDVEVCKLQNENEVPKSPLINRKLVVEHLNSINNTTSADKDFEYIKAPILKKTPKPKDDYADPINELESKGRRKSLVHEDEPPFNFQAMLRKTNYRKEFDEKTDSDKDTTQNELFEQSLAEKKNMLKGIKKEAPKVKVSFGEDVHVVTDVAPGITLEGVLVDL
ncbi:hypothetical protein PPYR_09073 [Photinus pyralis]|uniref:non-specific serine/threonine protein kinase n=3 Tax=Photinus pyralis TaxID=7054 RepID=A0A5N4AL60_PHOPY|nr:neither inactivation nor afterpotential protein C [Photinus pyralis]KAB0798080.1 hypothetical protein PPYR_09073 [Photinus pyralis]